MREPSSGGNSVQFHGCVDRADFQRAPDIYFCWRETKEQKIRFFLATEELTGPHCVSFVLVAGCGQRCLVICVEPQIKLLHLWCRWKPKVVLFSSKDEATI